MDSLSRTMLRQLAVVLATVSVALAQTQNYFINPPTPGSSGSYGANLQWALGSQQVISWTSNYSTWILTIYQDNHAGGNPKALCKFFSRNLPFLGTPRSRTQLIRQFSSWNILQCSQRKFPRRSQLSMDRCNRSQLRHYPSLLVYGLRRQ